MSRYPRSYLHAHCQYLKCPLIAPVVILLTIMISCSFITTPMLGSPYLEMNPKDVQAQFGHLLTKEEWQSISRKNDFGEDKIYWPVDKKFEESLKSFLTNNKVNFRKIDFTTGAGRRKPITELTANVWGRIPSNLGIADNVIQLISWENHVNPFISMEKRLAPITVKLTHYEIPSSVITKDIAKYADAEIKAALVYINKKDGKEYVRWPIHPEDQTVYSDSGKVLEKSYHDKLEEALRAHHIPIVKKQYFYGMLTASRSLFVVDPQTHKAFSLKTGTKHTGGKWQHKPMEYKNVDESRYISDYIYNAQVDERGNKRVELQFLVPLYETIGIVFKDVNQGYSVREYKGLFDSNQKRYYLPAFSVQHNTFGSQFVLERGQSQGIQNTAENMNSYWRKNLNLPLARATAEFIGYTGLSYDSAHTQQYLVELNELKNPTGRIIFRDFGDTYILIPFFAGVPKERCDFVSKFPLFGSTLYDLWVRYGIFKSIKYSQWMFDQRDWEKIQAANNPETPDEIEKFDKKNHKMIDELQKSWRKEFFTEFEKVFSIISMVSEEHLRKNYRFGGTDRTYKTKIYLTTKKTFIPQKLNQFYGMGGIRSYIKPYFNITGCFHGASTTLDGKKECYYILDLIRDQLRSYREITLNTTK